MRHGSSNRRQRNRGGSGRRGGNSRSQVYDSNGPDVRIRGTAHQVAEKYVALAKDAAAADDTMMEQNYLQHAEHYQRIINSWDDGDVQPQKQRRGERSRPREEGQSKDEDLSLPTSILGEATKVESKAESKAESETSEERTPEVTA